MKIKSDKNKLVEADATDITDVNPSIDSTAEIADAIQDGAEQAVGADVSDAAANAAAVEAKDVAQDVGANQIAVTAGEDDSLGTVNDLTKILDRAYRAALRNRRTYSKSNSNVLIVGLPGSGKTATVWDWAKHNGVNIMYLNAKNDDLQAAIDGIPLRSYANATPEDKITLMPSTMLDPLDRPNSVLFLDELNRQPKQGVRAALLTLINEHAISGKDSKGMRHFDNMLFTIAAINPSLGSLDPGATKLNSAELSRFALRAKFDSNPQASLDYFSKSFPKRIGRLNKDDPDYQDDYVRLRRLQDLAMFMLSDPRFSYDGTGPNDDESGYDLDRLRKIDRMQADLLNQRSLTELLDLLEDGTAAELKDLIKSGSSGFIPETCQMLLDILNDYQEKPKSAYLAELSADGAPAEDDGKPADEAKPEEDDDDGLFMHSGKSGASAKTPQDIQSIFNAWSKGTI